MRHTLQLQQSRVIVDETKPQPASEVLKGRSIERLLSTGQQLLIRCTDGTELRMSWRDEKGRMRGTPYVDEVRRWK